MHSKPLAFAALAAATALALADDLPLMTHAELQAVNSDGSSTQAWTNGVPFAIRGILLNDPADMVSPVYVAGATNASMGGQFQVFVQAIGGDRGGTAVFMSQYNRQSHASYTETEWSNELARVTADPATGHRFHPGDCVEVTARRALHYNGKVNINEAHNISPDCDFDIRLVTPGVGLPPAEPVTLSDFVALAGDGTQTQIFDPARAAGGEHWQGVRVRLDAIRLADTDAVETWNHPHPETLPFGARLVTCADATGRTFPLRLPRRSLGPAPATNRFFSATGFINQEGPKEAPNTAGYELFIQEVGPVLDIAFEPATEDEGAPSAAVLTYSADYAGYQLQVSDDSGATWTNALAFPSVIIVHDPEASPTRFYRLVLPD